MQSSEWRAEYERLASWLVKMALRREGMAQTPFDNPVTQARAALDAHVLSGVQPDGWITEWRYAGQPDSWREPTLFTDRAEAERAVAAVHPQRAAAYPSRIRPVYFGRPASEQVPVPDNCGACHECLRGVKSPDGLFPITATFMLVCQQCGNKRCPKADDHRNACTGSNEPGRTATREQVPVPAEPPTDWRCEKCGTSEFYAWDDRSPSKEEPCGNLKCNGLMRPPVQPSTTEAPAAEPAGSHANGWMLTRRVVEQRRKQAGPAVVEVGRQESRKDDADAEPPKTEVRVQPTVPNSTTKETT